jgi:hypothetical protein
MRNTLRGLVVAPAPVFLLICLFLVRPSLGVADVLFGIGLALTASYGFMLLAGLPIHLILRRLRWQGWTHYVWAFLVGLLVVVVVLAWIEGTPPPPRPDDNSPFAALTLREGGGILLFTLCSPLVAIMASMFWSRVVRTNELAD